jgi:hypothetical protein
MTQYRSSLKAAASYRRCPLMHTVAHICRGTAACYDLQLLVCFTVLTCRSQAVCCSEITSKAHCQPYLQLLSVYTVTPCAVTRYSCFVSAVRTTHHNSSAAAEAATQKPASSVTAGCKHHAVITEPTAASKGHCGGLQAGAAKPVSTHCCSSLQ